MLLQADEVVVGCTQNEINYIEHLLHADIFILLSLFHSKFHPLKKVQTKYFYSKFAYENVETVETKIICQQLPCRKHQV